MAAHILFSVSVFLGLICARLNASIAESECSASGECGPSSGRRKVLRSNDPTPAENGLYDVYNCPFIPPKGYPRQWPAAEILKHWNPNETNIPEDFIFQGLCVFEFKDYRKAMHYLFEDVPFVMRNTPDFLDAVNRWDQLGYIEELMKGGIYPVHKSSSYQFTYWKRVENPPEGWTEPTEVLRIPFEEFQALKYNATPMEPHYYLYAEGYWSLSNENYRWHLFDELPRFKPNNRDLYHELINLNRQKLHCKFGMSGNMAAFHFDSSRNTIVLMQGKRRYLLADPLQCTKYALFDVSHPSSRHTSLHWTEFMDQNIMMNELTMQPGDALILPSYWFHSIIGLSHDNAQCNAWSTATLTWRKAIADCGDFGISEPRKE